MKGRVHPVLRCCALLLPRECPGKRSLLTGTQRAGWRRSTDRFLLAQAPGASPVCASAYFLTAAIVRRFSLSKLLTINLRRGRLMAGMVMSRTSQRLTRVLSFSGSNE